MKFYSFAHKDTGLFHQQTFGTDDVAFPQVGNNTPPDHIAIEGHHDHLCKKVDLETKEVIDYIPSRPSEKYEWNGETKRWRLTKEHQEKLDRRNVALNQIYMLEVPTLRRLREIVLQLIKDPDLLKVEERIIELRKDL